MTAPETAVALKAEAKKLSFYYGDFHALKSSTCRCTTRRSPR